MSDYSEFIRFMAEPSSAQGTGCCVIVPTLCVGMPQWTLCVRSWDAERPGLHSHVERGNDRYSGIAFGGAAEGCDLLIFSF
ncbi:hypothetical protein FQ192_07505 [Pseudomonas sp. ANT_J12]|nr:hypothetical protein FQ192_07505 [Pseudomonas sp. ANT_J12]